jgi:hypothetical protein
MVGTFMLRGISVDLAYSIALFVEVRPIQPFQEMYMFILASSVRHWFMVSSYPDHLRRRVI